MDLTYTNKSLYQQLGIDTSFTFPVRGEEIAHNLTMPAARLWQPVRFNVPEVYLLEPRAIMMDNSKLLQR